MPIATHELKIVSAEAKKEDTKQQTAKEVADDKTKKPVKTEKPEEGSSAENWHKKQSIRDRIGTKLSNTSKSSHQKTDAGSENKTKSNDKETTANIKTGESKRKDVDESNLTNVSTSDAQSSKGRKSSRKGSKKKQTLAEQTNKELDANNEEIQLQNVDSNKDNATNATNTQGAHDRNSNKSCCFCWCCCCSCSCLSVKNQGKGKENNKQQQVSPLDHYFNGNGDTQPSLEEIRTWGESFDKIMKCPWGRKVFRDFLKCEYSEENILFWLACEDLKMESNPELIEEKARLIYEDYISILSPKEVSLDSRVREIINKNMVAPTASTFDEAQLQIYTLMHRDSYPRFINSAMYRKLAQLPSPSRKGSTA